VKTWTRVPDAHVQLVDSVGLKYEQPSEHARDALGYQHSSLGMTRCVIQLLISPSLWTSGGIILEAEPAGRARGYSSVAAAASDDVARPGDDLPSDRLARLSAVASIEWRRGSRVWKPSGGASDGFDCLGQPQPAVKVDAIAVRSVLHGAGDGFGAGVELDQQLDGGRGLDRSIVAGSCCCRVRMPLMILCRRPGFARIGSGPRGGCSCPS
jgi:hypothetical protein